MITNSIIKDDHIIMTSVKTKDPIDYENKNIKEISLTNFKKKFLLSKLLFL